MISSLRGTLLEKSDDGIVLEVGGVGYSVTLSPSSLLRLPPPGGELLLYVEESVAMYGGGTTLYGFLSPEERRIFNVLRTHVPGTGAKKALEFLEKAAKSLPDFRRAVLEKDARALVALFGFTPKTAEKIAAGLHGKLEAVPAGKPLRPGESRSSAFEETIQGLLSLGYRDAVARQAAQAARASLGETVSAEALIREALRQLSGRP
jgi:holliday junction DNA helicase RuvA